jgi:Pyruvate/2-oxoacid:ferredoxin oxidoreductase delta subunit
MIAPEALGEFPAIAESIEEAREEGIEMKGGYRPAEFRRTRGVQHVRMVPTKVRKDPKTGIYRMLSARGKDLVLDADLVIVAIGQIPDIDLLGEGLFDKGSNKIYVNDFGMTPAERIYAGGDVIRQRPAVVDAIASGKRAALAIHVEALGGERETMIPSLRIGAGSSLSLQAHLEHEQIDLKNVVQFSDLNTLVYRRTLPHPGKKAQAASRIRGFGEVRKGLDQTSAIDEAKRCFNCGRCIQCDLCFLLCPDISIVKTEANGYEVNADYCKGCSICAVTCPRHVIEMGVSELRDSR